MASVIKRPGRSDWYAVFYNNGKKVRQTTGIKIKCPGHSPAQLKKEAQKQADNMEALAKKKARLDKQIDALRAAADAMGGADVPTVQDYLDNFKISGGEQNHSNVKRAFQAFTAYLGKKANERLDHITREVCQGFIDYEATQISPGTIRRYKGSIACAFNRAVRDGILMRSPMRGVALPKDRPLRRDLFTNAEIRRMLTELPEAWRDMVLICLGTAGQRIGDCACIKWEHIDFEKRVICFDTHKTGYGVEVPMLPELYNRLMELRNKRAEGEVYVLPMMASKYLRSKGYLSTEFTTLLKGLGIAYDLKVQTPKRQRNVCSKSFHGLRNYAVTTLRDTGAGEDLTCALVGHENTQQDRAYYRASMVKKQVAMQRFGKVLFSDPDEGSAFPDTQGA